MTNTPAADLIKKIDFFREMHHELLVKTAECEERLKAMKTLKEEIRSLTNLYLNDATNVPL